MDGDSLRGLLRGDSKGWRNNSISHNFRPGWERVGGTIRTPQWRYIENGDGTKELYDAVNDPWNWNNLVNAPEHARLISELSAQVAASFQTAPNP
jgi:hypothetical protein